MRILIVDDEAGIRKTTRIAIETAGHEAAEAPNGARAMKAIEEEAFDVVFLDLKLGFEDGLDVLARLLACPCVTASACPVSTQRRDPSIRAEPFRAALVNSANNSRGLSLRDC